MLVRHAPMKRKAKAKPAAERRHHQRVAQLSCMACDCSPVEVHHVRHDGRAGISRNHRLVIPLCSACHRTGENAVHRIGHPAFNELFGINMMERARRLWEETNG